MDGKTAEILTTKEAKSRGANVDRIHQLIRERNEELLTHRYFHLARGNELDRPTLVGVLKHLYCFSTLFERLLTRRIAEYSNFKDQRILRLARAHLREEGGHADEFRRCLVENGVPVPEIEAFEPKVHTKAVFGYLLATIQHESEYVANVAIMQAMESIAPIFFTATLRSLHSQGMTGRIIEEHADEAHANLGLDVIAGFDERTMIQAQGVLHDVYRLMWLVFDEWLGLPAAPSRTAGPRRRKTSRPPKAN